MAIDARTIIDRWFKEVWNLGREEAINELMAPDAVAHGLGETDSGTHGPAGFKPFWRNLRSAIPDAHITVEEIVAEADKAVARFVLDGTHRGDGLGVPPTGRRVRVRGMVLIRVASGQLVEGWNNWDQLSLLQQIGAVPAHNNTDRFLATST